MRVSHETFAEHVVGFLTSEVMPAVSSEIGKFSLGGMLALGAFSPARIGEMAQTLGFADASGVDIDQLETFLEGGFKVQPHLKVDRLGVTFEASDAQRFIATFR